MVIDKVQTEALSLEMEVGDEEKLPTLAEARARFDQIDAVPPKAIPETGVKPVVLPTVPKATPVVAVGSKVAAPISELAQPADPTTVPKVVKDETNVVVTPVPAPFPPEIMTKKSVGKGKKPPPLKLVTEPYIDDWEEDQILLPRLLINKHYF